MHRQAGRLAGDVPQRDVDIALHGRVEHPGPHPKVVPDRADVERVAPDEQLLRAAEELGRHVDARAGHEDVAVDAFIGGDRDHVHPRRGRAHARRHDALVLEDADISDLHDADDSLVPVRPRRYTRAVTVGTASVYNPTTWRRTPCSDRRRT